MTDTQAALKDSVKNVQICLIISPELTDAIKEKSYNERLSVNKFMIKCAETYLNSEMNKD